MDARAHDGYFRGSNGFRGNCYSFCSTPHRPTAPSSLFNGMKQPDVVVGTPPSHTPGFLAPTTQASPQPATDLDGDRPTQPSPEGKNNAPPQPSATQLGALNSSNTELEPKVRGAGRFNVGDKREVIVVIVKFGRSFNFGTSFVFIEFRALMKFQNCYGDQRGHASRCNVSILRGRKYATLLHCHLTKHL